MEAEVNAMGILSAMDRRVKRLGTVDWKLAQGGAICVGLVVVKIFPAILNLSVGWFVIAGILLGARPLWVFLGNERP
jgi:hypothetical protein